MDVLPSAEFRKRYASLTKPTKVTVNGHTIGVWTPGGPNPDYNDMPDVIDRMLLGLPPQPRPPAAKSDRYNTRPFTPVPKHK
jgi:hypothetical protein